MICKKKGQSIYKIKRLVKSLVTAIALYPFSAGATDDDFATEAIAVYDTAKCVNNNNRLDSLSVRNVGSGPLVIIDGKESEHQSVNHDNVASLNILKGDEATKQYGNKGKDGVILVVTKDNFVSSIPQTPTKPLVIIDGKESTEDEFQNMKQENIRSLSILKNESATKLYGEKGKNGVIIVVTI
jgi:hypothetical protein